MELTNYRHVGIVFVPSILILKYKHCDADLQTHNTPNTAVVAGTAPFERLVVVVFFVAAAHFDWFVLRQLIVLVSCFCYCGRSAGSSVRRVWT